MKFDTELDYIHTFTLFGYAVTLCYKPEGRGFDFL